jgi:hypothetical protein
VLSELITLYPVRVALPPGSNSNSDSSSSSSSVTAVTAAAAARCQEGQHAGRHVRHCLGQDSCLRRGMLPFACVCQNQTIQQPFTMVCAHLIKMQVATLTTSYTIGSELANVHITLRTLGGS